MTSEESILDAVNRLEQAISRLELLLKGDTYTDKPGLVADVRKLENEVSQLASVKLSAGQWLLGFVLFVGGVFISNHVACGFLNIPTNVGISFAILLWMVSAVFFLSGLGMLKWK